MTHRLFKNFLYGLLAVTLLSSCSAINPFTPPTATPEPPTATPAPTPTPTATPVPFYLTANVWSGDLQVPILIYHRFRNDSGTSDSTHARYADFKTQLQNLYDAGFSLVSISSWLDGTFIVPEGRKPLVLTMDDGWFADQLFINDDGSPSEYSGIGILWQFAKDHPDFNFAVSINVNMGDKYYADIRTNDWFVISDGNAWKEKLANTIVWALENGVEVYNHTYSHAMLSETDPEGIQYQLQKNDTTERDFLALVNRSDLDAKLGNIIALPYGEWPSTQAGVDVVKNYVNPEGKPVQGILEAYNLDEAQFTPSIFSDGFNKFSIPRITATNAMVDLVISKKEEIPTLGTCQLGPLSEKLVSDATTIQGLIASAVQSQTCPAGIYHVDEMIFVAKNGSVTLFQPKTGNTN